MALGGGIESKHVLVQLSYTGQGLQELLQSTLR